MPKLSLAKLERHLYSAADRLRQEGLDAATYKDYIFGMLFLKRCSDVFDAERERIVGRKVEQGMIKEVAETQYGENPDFYDGFGVRGSDYFDFAPALADRSAIRTLVENDAGVQAHAQALRDALAAGWTTHAPRLADLPEHRELNRVRAEFLYSFVAALLPLDVLDRFKLAGVIATWWTDTLPDFKTLIENGFPGVIDGWVDAIADAVEDDEATGPAFDPFGHKLVRRTMADYLERIAAAKADIARLKGEKEAFEQSNAPDDADEEELANWNYAKDLDRQARELKAEHRDAFKELARLEKAAAKARATDTDRRAAAEAKAALQPVLDRLAAIEAELAPYEQIKTDLAAARARYRTLTNACVGELKTRCGVMSENEKRSLVLELFAQDVQAGLDAAVAEKRQELVRFVEKWWDKYRVTLTALRGERAKVETRLENYLKQLAYTNSFFTEIEEGYDANDSHN